MNKSQLVDAIATETGLSKAQAAEALDSAVNSVQREVAKGGRVTLPGFGTFERRSRRARTGRNPQTGAAIKVKASKVPAFKPGATFKSIADGKTKPPAKKKPAAKKPAARKTAAKKPAARKPAAKKPAARKPAAKKPAARKTAAKKPAAKKPAAKRPAAKKPAAKKSAAKKPAAKKSAAKKKAPAKRGAAKKK